jgi:alkylation response protein AidB-like acyl-CoA dehydrogenase
MNFKLTPDHEAIIADVKAFAKKEIAPLAAEIDSESKFPAEIIKKMAELGYMGINIQEEYGGSGLDDVYKVLVVREIAKYCASTAEILAVQSLVNDIIIRKGTEEQKQKYLPMVNEGKLGAFALTEAGAGSDAGAVRTKAISDGDNYIINGSKCFISNMGPEEGDFVILIALTDPSAGMKGMSAIIVDRGTPGFSIGKVEDKMGIRGAAVSELIFEDCVVPKTNLVGKEGEGFKIAMSALDGGRIGIAAQALGIAEAAIEASVEYSKQRNQFGKPVSALQGIQWYLADMATRTEAAKLLILQAADMRSRGENVTKEAAMAKYYASENAVYVTDRAVQIHGGYGYMKDYPIERMYRDARITPLYEGTSEVQKMVISRAVIGK